MADKSIKIMIGIGALVLILGGLLLVAEPDQNSEGLSPKQALAHGLEANETNYDFGNVSMKAGKVSRIFEVKNIMEEELELEKMYTSCMCTEAWLIMDGKELGPFGMPGHSGVPPIRKSMGRNQNAQIKVVFDPAAHGPSGLGPIARSVILESKDHAPLTLDIKANVTP